MIPVDLVAGRASFALSPAVDGVTYQTVGVDVSQVLNIDGGSLEMRVMDQDNVVIGPSGYQLVTNPDGTLGGIQFTGDIPSGPKLSCYVRGDSSSTTYALSHDGVYDGDNEAFNKVVVTSSGVRFAASPSGTDRAYVVLQAGLSGVTADFWYRSTKSKYFCGESSNWIGPQAESSPGVYQGHINLGPDVFVGSTDYPGDGAIDSQGAYQDPGPLPKFVDPGTYQISYRDGLVRFPAEVDTEELVDELPQVVRANYAHLVGIRNFTGMKLDPVSGSGGLVYKAQSELVYPEAHGKRWVTRNDDYLPQRVYVDGVLTPTPQSVLPHEILTVKLS